MNFSAETKFEKGASDRNSPAARHDKDKLEKEAWDIKAVQSTSTGVVYLYIQLLSPTQVQKIM